MLIRSMQRIKGLELLVEIKLNLFEELTQDDTILSAHTCKGYEVEIFHT